MKQKIEELSQRLRDKQKILTCAESCTGGLIAAAITEIPGSSDIFDRGFITYSNAAKREMLGANPATIETFGAVSEQCAKEMVLGALKNSAADIAVAVTGIAGPTGDTPDKPIGLVYIAVGLKGMEPYVSRNIFKGNRSQIRKSTCEKAFSLLISVLDEPL